MGTSGIVIPEALTQRATPVEAVSKSDMSYPYEIGDRLIVYQWYNGSISTSAPMFEYLFEPSTGVNYPTAQWTWNDLKHDSQPVPFASFEHKISSGLGLIPAGEKAVIIKATSAGVTVEGIPLSNGDIFTISATTSGRVDATLPSISPVGGTWAWASLDNVEV